MAEHARRGNPLVFDYEHEGLIPLEKRGGSPMKGVASAPHSEPEIRRDSNGNPELWASDIEWTPEARRQIVAKERGQISPVCDFDLETGEVLSLKNVALCREGATHFGTLLASVAKGMSNMDELIKAACDAAAAMDWAKLADIAAQGQSMGGTAPMAKPEPPPAAVAPPPAAMAASRSFGDTAAFSRELAAAHAKGDAAIKEARTGRVEGLIAASRDCFDAADEREHLTAADPDATKRHIASVRRKLEAGTIAASRDVPPRNPPKVKVGGADETYGLSLIEIQAATKMNVPLVDYAAAVVRNEKVS